MDTYKPSNRDRVQDGKREKAGFMRTGQAPSANGTLSRKDRERREALNRRRILKAKNPENITLEDY